MTEEKLISQEKRMKNRGFGTKLNGMFREAVEANNGDFPLSVRSKQNPTRSDDPAKADFVRYDLHFNKAKKSDDYFFNGFTTTLHKAGEPVPYSRYFSYDNTFRVTALDAYQLLSGRFVEKTVFLTEPKEGEKPDLKNAKKVWIGLDLEVANPKGQFPLKTYYEGYKYDLEAAVAKYKATGFDGSKQADENLKMLRLGYLVPTSIPIDKKQTPVFIAANPANGLDVYNRDLKLIPNWHIFPEMKQAFEEKKAAATAAKAPAEAPLNQIDPVSATETPATSRGRGR